MFNYRTIAGLLAVLLAFNAHAQTLPSPKFNNITIQGNGSTGSVDNMTVGGTALSTRLGALVPGADVSTQLAPGKIPRFYNINGTGIPAVDLTGMGVLFQHVSPTGQDVHSFRIDRDANYTGGTFGFVNGALRVNSTVRNGAISFENAAVFHQDNYANVGTTYDKTPQNTAVATQANRYGTAPLWAQVTEAVDRTGQANPATGHIGIELDITANGTDTNNNRIGIALFAGRPGNASGNFTGDPVTVGTGMLFTKQTLDGANNRFETGLKFGSAAGITDFGTGIDFSGASFLTGGPAIKLAEKQKLAWDASAAHLTRYEQNYWRFSTSGTEVVRLHENGSATFGPVNPLTLTGYGTIAVGNPTSGGVVQVTDGLIDARVQASKGAGMTVGTYSNDPLIFYQNSGEGARVTTNRRFAIPTYSPPTSSSACQQGEMSWDGLYVYVCVTNNLWRRTALSTGTW